ncbi:vancomycin resistance protein VanW [Desulfotomaculum arcticum]|uniref:Vancomycin resistance protein VanW n=1 Tax=Desulfotruncus arcticus DSM 17038 TaxID=1121424 RepID=A0A1I2Y1J2_9FIRM|nr:VanW family protein [Desulfotruncus arcticus]SFH18826.1 vancomycin resistance protein VanW [Desulfotomaculum arcticum] [Desulfotruncus arcticus DSM 17038]
MLKQHGRYSPPQIRSRMRMSIGRFYFTWTRYVSWLVNWSKYAGTKQKEPLKFIIYNHQTPLLRKLRNVDMWLQQNKIRNLKIAAQCLNDIVIKPGETFSFWRVVGKPTKNKGYVKGMVLYNGSITPEVGGGLCQLSNLIYWMTLHTSLTVTERWRHSYDVFPDAERTQPFGSGATVAYNYVDLQIKNNTNEIYQLNVWVGDVHLHGQWRCSQPEKYYYRVYETNHIFTHEQWGGYMRHNILRRKIFDISNNVIGDDYITENHSVMIYAPLLSDGELNN